MLGYLDIDSKGYLRWHLHPMLGYLDIDSKGYHLA
jgi:hypothetical protein